MTGSTAATLPDKDIAALLAAERVVILTGAGMSAESGVSTFRDPQKGLWAKYRPAELATPEAFAANPSRVWEWYQWRRSQLAEVQPHAGYHALVEMENQVTRLHIITQNVDGLHRAAGSSHVIELHGNIRRSICSRTRKPIDDDWIQSHEESPPPSPHAQGAYARPDVVWFGEMLPEDAWRRATGLAEQADVFISIGTSALVQPAASMPLVSLRSGARLIEINPEPTPLSGAADCCLRAPAGRALPAVVGQLKRACR